MTIAPRSLRGAVRLGEHPAHGGPLDPTALVELPAGAIADALERTRAWDGPAYRPGEGGTRALWELLATTAAHDLGLVRAVEPVLDARAILAQAGGPALPRPLRTASTWGVFAAEDPTAPLVATPHGGSWRLEGVKPWCSLADLLEGALVTATTPDGDRRLFAVGLTSPGVGQVQQPWVSRGLEEIPSRPVRFADVAATPIGSAGWYLSRPGFWWGGIGVAACWYGGAVGIARRVLAKAGTTPHEAPASLLAALGRIDERLADGRRALNEAARLIDAPPIDAPPIDGRAAGQTAADPATPHPGQGDDEWRLLAKRVRATVARSCEDVLRLAADALGPAPLTSEEKHAKRVADLSVYLRQHAVAREAVSLGRTIATARDPW